MGYVITIDGPAASGKSSLSRALSKKFNIPWVSTGAFYRGLAYAAIQKKIPLTDKVALSELALSAVWKVEMTNEKTRVWFNDQDVTDKIAQEEVGNFASQVSHYPEVRSSLLDHQRKCAFIAEGLIAEGRDCGTVVFPQAEAKIYLTASSENRAQRRAEQLGGDEKKIVAQQHERDQQDTTRKAAPLQVPKDSLVLDTTNLSFEEVVNQAENFVRLKLK